MIGDERVDDPGGADAPAAGAAPAARTPAPAPATVPVRPATRSWLPVAVTGVLLAGMPLLLGDSRYLLALASGVLLHAAYAIGFNVVFGLTGQLFLCVGALAGVAGYSSVVLTDDLGWVFAPAALVGVALATVLGGAISWVAARRRVDAVFLGVVTLACSLIFANLAQGLRDLTGGETGRVVTGGTPLLADPLPAYYLLLGVVVGFLAVHRWIERSATGWAFQAVKDDEVAAALAGVDVTGQRVLAGVIGSAMIGTTGVLFAHHEAFVSPTSYAFAHVDVRTLVVVAFGGVGTLLGPVVGAVALGVVDEVLRPLGQLRLTVYGLVLLLLFLGLRQGVVPAVAAGVQRVVPARRGIGRGGRRPGARPSGQR